MGLNEEGILPTKNFQQGTFDDAEKIDGAGSRFKDILVGRDSCYFCDKVKKYILFNPGSAFHLGPSIQYLHRFKGYQKTVT